MGEVEWGRLGEVGMSVRGRGGVGMSVSGRGGVGMSVSGGEWERWSGGEGERWSGDECEWESDIVTAVY